MGDEDKQYSITLDPSYTYSSGDTSGITVTMPDLSTDYDIDTNSGTFTIDTNTPDTDWLHDPNITVPENADIKIGDRSLKTFMDTMEKRMAILQPDPKKLEKFEALQKAYEHYKHLERLCELDDDGEKKGPNW